ncbi:hypothetical protein ACOMHN_025084 [Nucella lapillus]
MWMGSVGQELHHLEKERAIQTDPEETRRRRTIQLIRKDADTKSWGFTLQTYGIRNKRTHEVEVMTYVDYVELHGPAWIAGMRRGDVLLSVNGESVEGLNHARLVEKIQQSKATLRLVVLFEDCCRKVELYERYIKLKRILSQKMRDLRQLELEEKILCSGGRLSRVGVFRDSIRSSTSSDWDCYSEVTSPGVLDTVAPNQRMWRQHFFARSVDTLDTTSELSLEYSSPFGSSRESLGATLRDSLTQKDSSSETAGEKSKQCTGAAHLDSARNSHAVENSHSGATKTEFCLEDESDSEVATLRRRKDRSSSESKPGGRARSNSTLLNDMRMILIAEVVSAQASEASRELGASGDCGGDEVFSPDLSDRGSVVSDSEVIVVVDEDDAPCRMYRGVRINERDEVTRL